MVPTDNVGFVREFQNSVYGDDGYENVHPGSPTELDLSGRFVVNDSYGKVKRDGYVDPNELKASRSSSELFDNPLYEVVEESSSSIENGTKRGMDPRVLSSQDQEETNQAVM